MELLGLEILFLFQNDDNNAHYYKDASLPSPSSSSPAQRNTNQHNVPGSKAKDWQLWEANTGVINPIWKTNADHQSPIPTMKRWSTCVPELSNVNAPSWDLGMQRRVWLWSSGSTGYFFPNSTGYFLHWLLIWLSRAKRVSYGSNITLH